MAGSFNDFSELEVLDHTFAAATWTPGATLYLGLWTTTLVDASTGSTGTEVTGSAYARIAVTSNATNWPAAAAGAIANGVQQDFPTASGGNWGACTDGAILDASSAGNMIAFWDLTVGKTINDGDDSNYAVGDIDFTLD